MSQIVKSYLRSWVYPERIQLSEQFAFGTREILLSFSDLHPSTLFRASIQHGWVMDAVKERPTITKKNLGLYPDWVWSKRVELELHQAGRRNAVAIGSPFAHLVRKLSNLPPPIEKAIFQEQDKKNKKKRYDLLLIPTHSYHGLNWDPKKHKEIEFTSYSSKAVLLYWSDFVNPQIREHYQLKGFEILCAGYRGSSGAEYPSANLGGRVNFMVSLLEILLSSEYVALEEVSSAFWYCAFLRKKIFLNQERLNLGSVPWFDNIQEFKISNSDRLIKCGVKDFPFCEWTSEFPGLYESSIRELGMDLTVSAFRNLDSQKNLKLENLLDGKLVTTLERHLMDFRKSFESFIWNDS